MATLRRTAAVVILAAVAALVPAVSGFTATTSLDPSFGSGGVVRFDDPPEGWAMAVAVQPDGKLVVAGTAFEPEGHAIITRLLPDGQRDPGFGTNGRFHLDDGPAGTSATGVAVRPDGRILMSLAWRRPDLHRTRLDLVQVTPAGHLDTSFGQNGVASGPEGAFVNTERSSVALQPDGKVLLASDNHGPAANGDMYVARFHTDGTPDTAFGSRGLAWVDFSTSSESRADVGMAVAAMGDGRIVVGGESYGPPGSPSLALARLMPTGAPDSTFGVNGRVLARLEPPASPWGTILDLAVREDGKVVVGGKAHEGHPEGSGQFLVAQFTDSGVLDPSFGTAGATVVDGGEAMAVALDTDGRIVAGGRFGPDFMVARVLPTGAFDPTFGENGLAIDDLAPSIDQIIGIAVQPDGKVVAAGQAGDRFTVVRYKSHSGRSGLSDYDGDGKSDIGVYRPSTGVWYVNRSGGGMTVVNWGGVAGDVPTPGDYDGDGTTDVAVFRPSTGIWYVNRSSGGTTIVNWGSDGDVPTPGDYDGDGTHDIAVFRPATGIWYVQRSSGGTTVVNWGTGGDIPTTADYDGDGKDDMAVFRPTTGTWYVNGSTAGLTVANWGSDGDVPKAADYDGDGKADIAVFRPANGVWYVSRSGGGTTIVNWGSPGDTPTTGDYDGDGKADMAVFRPATGIWYFQGSGGGTTVLNWGADGDIPTSGA